MAINKKIHAANGSSAAPLPLTLRSASPPLIIIQEPASLLGSAG